MLFSRSSSSPGFSLGAGRGRDAGGMEPLANPAQTWRCSGRPQQVRAAPSAGRWRAPGRQWGARSGTRRRLRSLNPSGRARDDDQAGKVRRARREAAWHAPLRLALGVLRGCTNSPGPTGLRGGEQYGRHPLLLEPREHLGAVRRAHSPHTADPAARDPSSKPFPRPSFFPSSACPQRVLQPAAKFSHDTGDDIHEMVGQRAGVRSALGLPTMQANSADESGVVAAVVKSPWARGGLRFWRRFHPAVSGWGWRSRLPRGYGAPGTRRRRCSRSRRRPRLSRRLH